MNPALPKFEKEKKFSKARDELNLQRRKLPWVKVEKEYVFDGQL